MNEEDRPGAPDELLDFTGRSVLVTGASSGIGAGIALRFAEAGAAVTVNYLHNAEGARQVLDQIAIFGRKAVAFQADVGDRRDVEALIAGTIEHLGGLDVVVNNAGIYPVSSLLEMKDSEWDEVLEENLRSVHLCTQVGARHMIRRGQGGAIVNIASINAENPGAMMSHYDASKAAIIAYTRSAAQELGGHGIRVNAVSPGVIWRSGIEAEWPDGVERYLAAAPLGRLGRPDDVADACLFLASPAARWITGVNLTVDGGVLTHRVF
jgi:NAD(P)-dependent dehydrogenase (short-subunit alcohol dehydrogenase family)